MSEDKEKIWTDWLEIGDPLAPLAFILDKDENIISKVFSYNIVTKEAIVYEVNENNHLVLDKYGEPKKNKVVLEGSRLVFRKTPITLKVNRNDDL
jgi:hypothetical protein